jgi:uroporphyrinogen-III synthase
MTRVLVLRPEPGASATVQRARLLGLDAVAVPLFEIAPVNWQASDPGAFDGLLLTSANAVRHGGMQLQALRGLNVYAVGEATAATAHEAGFNVAVTGNSGVDQLLASIDPHLKLLHLCGADRQEPAGARQAITPLIVYRSEPIDMPNFARDGMVALVHSPRAGRRLAELVKDRSAMTIAAISHSAAEAAGGGWKTVEAAQEPRDDALLALAARLCNKPQPK